MHKAINTQYFMAQMVKNLPPMPETQVPSLGQEDPLERGMATHSSILAWRIPWTEYPGGLQSMGLQSKESDTTDWLTHTHIHTQVAPRKGITLICGWDLKAIFILKRNTEMVGEGLREYGSKCFFSAGSDSIAVYLLSVGFHPVLPPP